MSTLSVGTIQSNTTSPPTINNSAGTAIGTFCRAWVNFNGTGVVAIRASFNVTSITDNGTGDYTVNFTTAFADANYAITVTSGKPPGVTRSNSTIPHNTVPATGSCRMGAYDGAQNAQQDAEFVSVLVFR